MSFSLPPVPYHLERGVHSSREEGMCLLELAAYLAGSEHTDAPACVSRSVRVMGNVLNDRLDDERRQLLRPYVLRMLGTAGDGRERERERMCREWLVRYALPAWLDLADRPHAAQRLRELPGDLTLESVQEAIEDARAEAQDARDKAYVSLRQRISDKLRKQDAVATVAAYDDAIADAVTVATAVTAAATAATAAVATVATVAAVADADATATVAALDAAADAAVADLAITDATAFKAVYEVVSAQVRAVVTPVADEMFASALDLFNRMLPDLPLTPPTIPNAQTICAAHPPDNAGAGDAGA